jgi:hypothetical protein
MPGPSYLFSHLSLADVIARVRSLARWRTVAAAMGREIWLGGATYIGILPLTVVIAITLGHPRHWPRAAVAAAICTAGMLAVDASVYLLLSPNLVWHLSTSVDRVIVQLTPTIVWALLMLAGRSGDLD